MFNGRRYILSRLLLATVAVALPLLALNVYLLAAQRRDNEGIASTHVQSRAERASREVDRMLARVQRLLALAASRPELQSREGDRCSELLLGLTSVDPLMVQVAAVDLSGRPMCRPVAPAGQMSWLARALAHDEAFVSEPYVSEFTRRQQVSIVWPVRDAGGRRTGLLAAALDLEAVAESALSGDGLPAGSVVSLVTPDDRILATSAAFSSWIGSTLVSAVAEPSREPGNPGFIAIGKDGVERVMTFRPVESFGLRVGVGVPRQTLAALGDTRYAESLFGILAAAMLGFGVAAHAARGLSGPVASLSRSAARFAEGDLDARADEGLPGEFRDLALEFNRMFDASRHSEEARRARASAEAANQAKSQFLAHMSHEIRTPMNAVLGLTDLALRGELNATQRSYLEKVKTAATSLLGILNNILDFSKIEAGRLELDRSDFRLQDVLDGVTAVVGLRAQQKGLELLIHTAPDVPVVLRGDSLRLEQVLINLCSNSVKFTAHGEIVIVTVTCLDARDPHPRLRFAVRDTGKGMTEQQVARLFEPFNQLDASITREHGGTGLGLAICKQLVTLMGGEISGRSEPGVGTEFQFTARFDVALAPTVEPAGVPSTVGRRVLIVDDSATAREIFESHLMMLGCRSVLVASAAEALKRLETGAGLHFDVAIIDWRLPDRDGIELARRIKAMRAADRVVLAVSYGDDELARRAKAAGLDAHLFKPINRESLVEVLTGDARDADPPPPAPPGDPVPAVLRGRRVLLVEDNEFNQMVAVDLLTEVALMDVTIAGNGAEAIELVKEMAVDVVLMDVQMPRMDGLQATREIRRRLDHQALPIIAMTAHALPTDRDRCLQAGMNDYITKPIQPAELFATLARWLALAGLSSRPGSNGHGDWPDGKVGRPDGSAARPPNGVVRSSRPWGAAVGALRPALGGVAARTPGDFRGLLDPQ